ncbi:ABC transporter permease subunit [Mycetocola tolaasinivorans]|uniref:ABC transporter permease subunit n=1 Tax=Mycetocola tolaasinivorans TaxID=76635 RepID=A0A3L7A6P4_9MICO|nr:ABC transporter permease subunit [Mycetocola tolaasinivorans]RLP75520.1 ABC transporter permease subunit [Mycetocola tolaasinivorans]
MSAKPRHPLAPARATRIIILAVIGALFAVPIASMVEFTLRDPQTGGHTLNNWASLFAPDAASTYEVVWTGIGNSLLLSAFAVAVVLLILVPTMVYVEVEFPRLSRVLEFICLIPLSLPAIVLVVGYVPVYQFIGRTVGTDVWSLGFAYGIIVLPFAHRALKSNLDAIGIRVLSEAGRTLGDSWFGFLWRVAVPNLRSGISAAVLITVAVVFGEFTLASLLNRTNLQTALNIINWQNPFVSVAISLVSLIAVFLLLLAVSGLGRVGVRRTRRPATPTPVSPTPLRGTR